MKQRLYEIIAVSLASGNTLLAIACGSDPDAPPGTAASGGLTGDVGGASYQGGSYGNVGDGGSGAPGGDVGGTSVNGGASHGNVGGNGDETAGTDFGGAPGTDFGGAPGTDFGGAPGTDFGGAPGTDFGGAGSHVTDDAGGSAGASAAEGGGTSGGAGDCPEQCSGATPTCDAENGVCVGCLRGSDCPEPGTACDVELRSCRPVATCDRCNSDADCGEAFVCYGLESFGEPGVCVNDGTSCQAGDYCCTIDLNPPGLPSGYTSSSCNPNYTCKSPTGDASRCGNDGVDPGEECDGA